MIILSTCSLSTLDVLQIDLDFILVLLGVGDLDFIQLGFYPSPDLDFLPLIVSPMTLMEIKKKRKIAKMRENGDKQGKAGKSEEKQAAGNMRKNIGREGKKKTEKY